VPGLRALIGWVYIFQASGWAAIRIMLIWTAAGAVAFLIWARAGHAWPVRSQGDHAGVRGRG